MNYDHVLNIVGFDHSPEWELTCFGECGPVRDSEGDIEEDIPVCAQWLREGGIEAIGMPVLVGSGPWLGTVEWVSDAPTFNPMAVEAQL